MATSTGNQRFVDEITREIIQPGVERLMESRYFYRGRDDVALLRPAGCRGGLEAAALGVAPGLSRPRPG